MKDQVVKVLIFQTILGGIYLLGTALWELSVTPSALVGCVAALVPAGWFGFRMTRAAESNDAQQLLGYALRSEIGKWLLMAAILAIAFSADYDWDPEFLFAGFVLVLVSGLIAPLVIKGTTENGD